MNLEAQDSISEEYALEQFLREKSLLVVNPKRKNGIILIKKYYAEFAGPGAVIGGCFDQDVCDAIALGKLSLLKPKNYEERRRAYLLRRQWVRLMKQITDNPIPRQRAQIILNQFEHWFDRETAAKIPDEVFALMVGVFPETIAGARDIVNRF
ncbi:MAG: hypothetical protein NZ901_10920 [Geminocystis sp.]|nr:hypothetical protein [Geminocystis sp.]HIK38176.1 hypothetical protein [Geminocystis sp. M7585_C2015_104]MCS7148685.1 hypothetical protein [Geminocystis sp.]MCX8078215.1 hypothetical protein [Geminocystis sp.]MDW8115101.1 hypothetical protein [Geminocystis sp.]